MLIFRSLGLRVFVPRGDHNPFWWTSWILICSHIIFYVINILCLIFACEPRRYIWELPKPDNAHCINLATLNIASGAFNSLTDIVLLILPHCVIWKLKMSFERKRGLSALFGIGIM